MNADELAERRRRSMSPLQWERVRRGLSIRDVCTALGIPGTGTLSDWEQSRRTPSRARMELVAEFYGMEPEALWGAAWAARLRQGDPPVRMTVSRQRRPAVPRPARRPPPPREMIEVPEEPMQPAPSRLRAKLNALRDSSSP